MNTLALLKKVDTWLASRVMNKPMPLRRKKAVISFTFDDAPASACQTGRKLLDKYAAKGTWYLSGGLTGRLEQGHLCHSIDDIRALAAGGHEIASHAFSHHPLQGCSPATLRDEFQRNGDFLESITGLRPVNFSFPLGRYGLLSKKLAGQQFQSSRLIQTGTHFGAANLNGLLAERLYSQNMSPERLASLIENAIQGGGWLIFYTHDVCDNPSPWGCTPELLETAIQRVRECDGHLLSVAQAIEYWQESE